MAFEIYYQLKSKIIYKPNQKSDVFIENTKTNFQFAIDVFAPHAFIGIFYLTDFVLRTIVIVSNLFIFKNYFTQFEVGLHALRFDKCFRSHWCMKLKHFSINYYKSKQVTKWSHNVLTLCIISTEFQLITYIATHTLCFMFRSLFLTSLAPNGYIHIPFYRSSIEINNLRMWEKKKLTVNRTCTQFETTRTLITKWSNDPMSAKIHLNPSIYKWNSFMSWIDWHSNRNSRVNISSDWANQLIELTSMMSHGKLNTESCLCIS